MKGKTLDDKKKKIFTTKEEDLNKMWKGGGHKPAKSLAISFGVGLCGLFSGSVSVLERSVKARQHNQNFFRFQKISFLRRG